MTTNDIDAIRNRAGRVRARTCEPGTDHEAYELARDAQTLLREVEQLRTDLAEERAEHQATGRLQRLAAERVEHLKQQIQESTR